MIDQTDLLILKDLKENARVNASEIAEHVKMSVSAVIERIRKMEAGGIIRQYTVIIDHKKLAMDIAAFISISLEHPKHHDSFIEAVNKNPKVVECDYITGGFDFMIKVIAHSTEDLTGILNEIKTIPGVSLTHTLLVLSCTKKEVAVIPEREEAIR